MLKVDDYTFNEKTIDLLLYEETDNESSVKVISSSEFEEWCIQKYGCGYVKDFTDKPFDVGNNEPHYVDFAEWWLDKYLEQKNKLLETYINRPELPIIGKQDEPLDQSFN